MPHPPLLSIFFSLNGKFVLLLKGAGGNILNRILSNPYTLPSGAASLLGT